MLEDLTSATVHGVGHGVVNGERFRVPLHFLGLATATTHEHQAEEGCHNEHADHDEDDVHVEAAFSVIGAVALNFFGWAVCTGVVAGNVKVGVEFSQTRFKGHLVRLVGVIGQLCLNFGDFSHEFGHVPVKEFLFHLGRRWKLFGRHPLRGVAGLVLLAEVVDSTDRETDVIHVSHAVGAGVATITVGGGNVHLLDPAGAGPGHVQVVLPEAVAGSGQLVAQGPGDRNHREGWRTIGQGKRCGWRLGLVGVVYHVNVEVAGAIIVLRDVKRKGVKDVHRDFVAVRGVAVRRRNRDGVDTDFLEVQNQVPGDQTSGTRFGRLWVVDPVRPLRAVNVRQAAVEVDDLLAVRLEGELLNVRHVEARCVVDGVDADGDRLVGVLLAVAGTKGDHRFAVDVVVNRFVAEGVASEFNGDEFGVRVVHDLERERRDVNRLTGVVRVGEVLSEGKNAAAAFVNHLNGQAAPARLTVLNDVEQKRTIGKFAAVGVVAAVIHTDFDALLAERATVVVREENFNLFGGWVPCNEVVAARRDRKVAQGCFRVAHVAVHADLGAQVAHDGRDGVGHDDGTTVGQFEHVFGDRPVTGLSAAVHGANAHVVVAGAHGHARRDDVFTTLLSRIPVEHVFATGNDASVPEVFACS